MSEAKVEQKLTVEQLEAKVKEYKLRIFDMAEQTDNMNKAYQTQQLHTQEFVTAIMKVVGMEMTESVMLNDVLTKVKEKTGYKEEAPEFPKEVIEAAKDAEA